MSRAAHDARSRIGDDVAMYPVNVSEVEAESTPETGEAERILRWRVEQFARLGFNLRARLVLAAGEADLAVARKLVGCGCPMATAEAILR